MEEEHREDTKTTQAVLKGGEQTPKGVQETNRWEGRKRDGKRRLSKTGKERQSHLLPVYLGSGRSRPGALHP